MTHLRIGYFNVEGLSREKHRICCGLMQAGLFDVLFLSETWFIKYSYMSHPYSFVQTVNENPDSKSRGHGGVLAMLNSRARSLVRSSRVLSKALWIDFGVAKVLATYLPPSMSDGDIRSCISEFPPYDFLLGDLNVRFKGITAKSPSPRPRQDLWAEHMRSRDSCFVRPTDEPFVASVDVRSLARLRPGEALATLPNCELDHAIRSSLAPPCELTLLGSRQFDLRSDHQYMLVCSISCSLPSEVGSDLRPGLERFHLGRLEDEGLVGRLHESWAIMDVETDWDVRDVDDYDSRLLRAVSRAAEDVLGSYDVLARKASADKAISRSIHTKTTQPAALRLYKMKRRGNGNVRIESRSGEKTPMEECADKYQRLFSDPSPPPEPPTLFDDDPLLPELRNLVSSSKIAKFVRKYPKDKSCGIDGIHTNLILALLPTSFLARLSRLFVLCLEAGRVPKRWNNSVMFPLPKDKGRPITCDAVRPLSILPMFRRTFESLLLPAFTNPSLDYCRLHPSQAGFRRGYSTLTQAMTCHHAIQSRRARYLVFLDFQAAYDVTLASKVMRALEARKMPARLRSLVLSSMFTAGSFHLVVNALLSGPISRSRGLPQGSPLSPVIFNLFIDPLVADLNRSHGSNIPRCLFYADDGVLLAQNLTVAKESLRIAERWAREQGMTYNVSKCGVLSLRGDSVRLTLDDRPIPMVECYKYLGFPITRDGIDFLRHRDELAARAEGLLKCIIYDGAEWPPSIRWAIYRTFVRTQMEYGAPLLKAYADARSDPTMLRPFQKIQDEAFAWTLSSSATRSRLNEGILGALPVDLRFAHLRCRFQFHLDQSSAENPLRRILLDGPGILDKFIVHFKKDALYDGFKRSRHRLDLRETHKGALSDALASYLSSLRREYIHGLAKDRRLLEYITHRTDGLVDRVLVAPPTYQRDFLAWRRGVSFLNRKCTCGELWTRGHLNCLPMDVKVPAKLREDFGVERRNRGGSYELLDHLLNMGKWNLAHEIISKWGVALR
jgi:Reverse transcriptase (RNA-dependent DNA polymerase)